MKYTKMMAAGCVLMLAAGTAAAQTTQKKTTPKTSTTKSTTNGTKGTTGTKPQSSAKTIDVKPGQRISMPARPANQPIRASKYISGPRVFSKPDAEGYITTNGDLQFKIVKKGTGTYEPRVGDMAEMNIKFRIGDSLLINTLEMNDNKPVQQQFQAPHFAGDLNEGLTLLKEGDSALFRIPMDTLAARAKQPKPEWCKPGDFASWEVKMVSIQSKEAFEAEREKVRQERAGVEEAELVKYFAEKGIKAQRTPSGLFYVMHEAGAGESPANGQSVTVNYTGMLLDGSKFDSNVDPEFNHVQAFDFPLGAGRVIKGWDEGVALMKKGGKVTLYIPSPMAYGERSPSPKIPANSILVFDIELVDFK